MIRNFLVLTGILLSSFARTQNVSFTGVYYVEEPPIVIALVQSNTAVIGKITDGQVILDASGSVEDDALTLEVRSDEGVEYAYASVDGLGNLWFTDEALNVMYFLRTEEDPDAIIRELNGATASSSGTNQAAQPASSGQAAKPKGTLSSKYAGKQFLHVYTGNGYSEKWSYYLYPDGHLLYNSGSNYSSNDYSSYFSAVTSNSDSGYWAVEVMNGQEYLNFSWNDGKSAQLLITKTNDGYLLNNTRYFLVDLNYRID
ncbi:MAG: hypothetical protein ACK500_02930 [Flavobacteriales bacterium]|jgi:hypothetical protein